METGRYLGGRWVELGRAMIFIRMFLLEYSISKSIEKDSSLGRSLRKDNFVLLWLFVSFYRSMPNILGWNELTLVLDFFVL